MLVATVVIALAETSATAAAAQTLCIGPPGSAVTVAQADGSCKKPTATAKKLVEQSELGALRSDAAALQGKVDALERTVDALEAKLSKVRYSATGLNGKPALTIDGANLQIVSGSGATGGTTNGLGNLFVGYDEQFEDTQTGSHNLIVGTHHSFTSYGGLLAGLGNSITSRLSFVSGAFNEAGGAASSVSGGRNNRATEEHSSVSGGAFNTASGIRSSVSGGEFSEASGTMSSVSGGAHNTAGGFRSSVSGGEHNVAQGYASSVLGGRDIALGTPYETSP